MIEDLQAELRRANIETSSYCYKNSVESNPKLSEALLNVEEDEAGEMEEDARQWWQRSGMK